MAISERTRKNLWVKAGGRCSLCRVQVAGDPTDADDASVFGEEAHIVARSPGGPRARAYAGDIDGYDNLMLLCSRHHKEIDDQVNSYPEARLLEIKRAHEIWISELGEKRDPGPTRLIPDPDYDDPKLLKLFLSGSVFWNEFDGCLRIESSRPERLSEEDEDLIVEFLQNLEDWMDIAGGMAGTISMKRDASRAMEHYISELAKAGFLLGAYRRHVLLTGGVDAPPVPWGTMVIQFQRASDAMLVDADGNPIVLDEAIANSDGE